MRGGSVVCSPFVLLLLCGSGPGVVQTLPARAPEHIHPETGEPDPGWCRLIVDEWIE